MGKPPPGECDPRAPSTANSESPLEPVFVYGTLRPPAPHTSPDDSRFYPRIAAYVRSVSAARLRHAVLYDVGDFPAARPGGGVVFGDLLAVDPAALPIMDRIEGHPHFFRRAQVEVETAAGRVRAWIYWAPPEMVATQPRIAEGDWFRRTRKQQANQR